MSSSSSITTARRAVSSPTTGRDAAGDVRLAGEGRFAVVRGAGVPGAGDASAVAAAFGATRGLAVDGFAVTFADADEVERELDLAGATDRADSVGAASALDARVELPMMIPPFRSPGSPHR